MKSFRLLVILCAAALMAPGPSGCAAPHRSNSTTVSYDHLLRQYPRTGEPVRIRKLDDPAVRSRSRAGAERNVFIMVHPAFAVFMEDVAAKGYSEAKYDLIKKQFYNETRFIERRSRAGDIVILILPAGSVPDNPSPLSYVSYLNKTALQKDTVFYLFSETPNNGALPTGGVLTLYRFLEAVRAPKVFIGGGYVGRCQGEFYSQFIKHFEAARVFIVPEASSISPEDVSDREAAAIFTSLRNRDYSQVASFIRKKTAGQANIRSTADLEDRP